MSPILNKEREIKFNRLFSYYRLYPALALLILFFIVINIFTQLARYSVYAASEYRLPYPGVLPNHRLYPLKVARDRLMEFFTRDLNKKSQLYLLYADKRMYMAEMLAKQQEWELAGSTALKAEKYLLKVRSTVEALEKTGGGMDVSFGPNIRQAALKHRQILNDLIKVAPSSSKNDFKAGLRINSEFVSWTKDQ